MSEIRTLAIGGCGCIGSALVSQLLADERVAEVVVLDSLTAGPPQKLVDTVKQTNPEAISA
jgi:dTDP-D-glucose 4,6-dehydratase